MSRTVNYFSREILLDFYTYAFDYDGNENCIYIGRAAIGSAKSSSVWQIIKFTYSGSKVTDKQWASKGGFTNVWDDRITGGYTYS